jgi:hypothetical protein
LRGGRRCIHLIRGAQVCFCKIEDVLTQAGVAFTGCLLAKLARMVAENRCASAR